MLKNLINRWKTKWMLYKLYKVYKNRPHNYSSVASQKGLLASDVSNLRRDYIDTLHGRLDYNVWFDDNVAYTIINDTRYDLHNEVLVKSGNNKSYSVDRMTLAEAILPSWLTVVIPLKEVVKYPESATVIAIKHTFGAPRGNFNI